ncbi:hypothetical protein QCA50_007950 [Cerrena zonata]|uniref:Uncharacterized protein n=1 Tax=Cerrena zonata TaxID=2478898 RepID=A0AAW0GHP8_9APHY
MDPLSRLPRAPLEHISPIRDDIPAIIPDSDAMTAAEEAAANQPALRATAALATATFPWEEIIQASSPLSRTGGAVETRSSKKQQEVQGKSEPTTAGDKGTQDGNNNENATMIDDAFMTDPELSHTYSKLLISMSNEMAQKFNKGYQEDPFFRPKWKKAPETEVPQYNEQCFYKNSEGLLFL